MITIYWAIDPLNSLEGLRATPPVPIMNKFMKDWITEDVTHEIHYNKCPAFVNELTNVYGMKSIYDYDIHVDNNNISTKGFIGEQRSYVSENDHFLRQKELESIQEVLLGNSFSWFFNYKLNETFKLKEYPFQLSHTFYENGAPSSQVVQPLVPILEILRSLSIYRIRANLLTKTSNHIENPFHVDMPGLSEEKQKQWTTSIFYVNTNDGYTVFEDGTKIESVANRMLTFPANVKHTGTTCTDQQMRVIINFNYYKEDKYAINTVSPTMRSNPTPNKVI